MCVVTRGEEGKELDVATAGESIESLHSFNLELGIASTGKGSVPGILCMIRISNSVPRRNARWRLRNGQWRGVNLTRNEGLTTVFSFNTGVGIAFVLCTKSWPGS